jgi:hypothetical protein
MIFLKGAERNEDGKSGERMKKKVNRGEEEFTE